MGFHVHLRLLSWGSILADQKNTFQIQTCLRVPPGKALRAGRAYPWKARKGFRPQESQDGKRSNLSRLSFRTLACSSSDGPPTHPTLPVLALRTSADTLEGPDPLPWSAARTREPLLFRSPHRGVGSLAASTCSNPHHHP